MPEPRDAPKICVDDIVEAAGKGAMRALAVRGAGQAEISKSGFYIQFHIICGIPPYELMRPAVGPTQVMGGQASAP